MTMSRSVALAVVLTWSLLPAQASAAADGWGASWSFGPIHPTDSNHFTYARTTLVPGRLPPMTSSTGPLFLWPGMSNPTSNLIQTTADAWPDNNGACGAAAGQWCVEASVFNGGQLNGPSVPIDPDDHVTIEYKLESDGNTWTQTVTSRKLGRVVSTLQSRSGLMPGAGFGFATEADKDSYTVDAAYFLCTELHLAAPDPQFGATGVGGVGAQFGATGRGSGPGTAKNLRTPDNGLTWLVDLITLPAMNPQGAQTPPPAYDCGGSSSYTLTTSTVGSGTVARSPDSPSYAAGTSVTLTARPASGYAFTSWSGDVSGTANPLTVKVDGNMSVVAGFAVSGGTTHALTVAKAGTGSGTVTSSPSGVSCGATCHASYASGASVTLTAAPDGGSTFAGWSGACSGTGSCTVSMTAARNVTATFSPAPAATHALTVAKAGTGSGTVTSSPSGVSCGAACYASYASGASVTLTAAPDGGSTFAGWSGGCSGTGSCTVSMTEARNVTATFSPAPAATHALTVAKAGTGSGTVTSSPSGVSCGAACTASYASGASVTLTAAPDGSSTFAGWSGGCSGTGSCTVSMTEARNVTARFDNPLPAAGCGSGGAEAAGLSLAVPWLVALRRRRR